jgi:hypothetical protein
MSSPSAQIPPLSDCLFCGAAPAHDRTAEDVFPKWLQHEFDLAERRFNLLNGSTVKYGQLIVPACRACNDEHVSLEQRVRDGTASNQDIWIWLLKLQLGTMYWEAAEPFAQDRRDPTSALPILDRSVFDVSFLHGVFQALRHPRGHFVPSPLGSVFRLPAPDDAFDYADSLYVHPLRPDRLRYSAAYVQIHRQAWIALFDDAGSLARANRRQALDRIVREGCHPRQVFPELMWLRSRHHHMPKSIVVGEPGAAQAVSFLPPTERIEVLPQRWEDLEVFYARNRIRSVPQESARARVSGELDRMARGEA